MRDIRYGFEPWDRSSRENGECLSRSTTGEDGKARALRFPIEKERVWTEPKKRKRSKGLNGLFADAGAVVVAHYSGMTVAQMGELRSRLRKAGASFKVAKNRLAMRALEGTPSGRHRRTCSRARRGSPIRKIPIAAPKVLVAYAKENEKLVILGGVRSARCSMPKA